LLVACGGGGGGSSEHLAQSATPLTLTESNYVGVSQTVLDGTDGLSSLSSVATGNASFFAAAQVDTQIVWMPSLISQVRQLKSRTRPTSAVLAGVQSSEPEACGTSGFITRTYNDQNRNNEMDVGDSITVSFSNCVDEGVTINGSFSAVLQSALNNSEDLSMTLSNFSVVSGSSYASVSGDMRLKVVEANNQMTIDLAINRISSASRLSGVSKEFTFSNFTATLVALKNFGNTTLVSQTYAGDLTISAYGNKKVSITTTDSWLFQNGGTYPYRGQMVIVGEAGSRIRMTAKPTTAVTESVVYLELDANGDGTYEKSETKAWDFLK
jgi:hypothetical protein